MTDTPKDIIAALTNSGDTPDEATARLEVFKFMLTFADALRKAGFTPEQLSTIMRCLHNASGGEDDAG